MKNEKKKYETPAATVCLLPSEDVISTSGGGVTSVEDGFGTMGSYVVDGWKD